MDRDDTLLFLVEQARLGNSDALDALLRRIQPDIFRRCNRFLTHHQDAEEACQDALLAVATCIIGFEGRSSFRTWFYAITANSARQTYRKLKRHAAEQSTDELPVVADRRTTSVIAGTRIDLLEALDHLELQSPELVKSLILREFAQLDYSEIAKELNLPVGTVKTHIHRGRKRLREILSENYL
jgi:RNA polymerase sigma-70 factor (ECF subfamily)